MFLIRVCTFQKKINEGYTILRESTVSEEVRNTPRQRRILNKTRRQMEQNCMKHAIIDYNKTSSKDLCYLQLEKVCLKLFWF